MLMMAAVATTGSGCNCGLAAVDDDGGAGSDGGSAQVVPDAGLSDAGLSDAGLVDAGLVDAGLIDAGPIDAGPVDAGPSDAGSTDAGPTDAGPVDAGRSFDCTSFSTPSGWTTAPGYRAVVFSTSGLSQPVALTFAGEAFGGDLYVVNQGTNSVMRLDSSSGVSRPFSTRDAGAALQLLTTITWDEGHAFDGLLYVGDQGSDGDGDSRLFRLSSGGALTDFAGPGGAGLDDVYGLVFAPPAPGWPTGLLVAGDTDGASTSQWGLVSNLGAPTVFSSISGVQGIATDARQTYGASVLASCPAGGGFTGSDSVTRVLSDGGSGGAVVSGIPGIHAVTVAPPGPFGGKAYAASWASGRLFALELDGGTTDVATGLALTNYDGNILAFSPDGRVLMVADRSANRVVCIEPTP